VKIRGKFAYCVLGQGTFKTGLLDSKTEKVPSLSPGRGILTNK